MKYTHKIALIVLIIGGLNWGFVGLVSIDLVDMIFGGIPLIARLVYVFVGLSALYITIESFKGGCKCCEEPCCGDSKKDSCCEHDKSNPCCQKGKCHDGACKVENKVKEAVAPAPVKSTEKKEEKVKEAVAPTPVEVEENK